MMLLHTHLKSILKNIVCGVLLSHMYLSGSAWALSKTDAQIYKTIFMEQDKGHWKQADAHIKQLDDKILMGHILYQRYMHPTAYRSSYKELHLWMKQYADHPNAKKIYNLALKRRPKTGWKALPKPQKPIVPKALMRTYKDDDILQYTVFTPPIYKSSMRRLLRHITRDVNRGRVTISYEYLEKHRRHLSREAHATALGTITKGYYKYHKTDRVFDIADEAHSMHPITSYRASWWAGLEAFRQGHYKTAINYFERAANGAKHLKSSLYSGAYYWAGRSAHVIGDMERAQTYWNLATKTPPAYQVEFYTLLSYKSLGKKPNFDFTTSAPTPHYMNTFTRVLSVQRAIALSQTQSYARAEQELHLLQPHIHKKHQHALMQLAYSLNLPYIQKYIARILSMDGETIYAGYAYPEIPYKPIRPLQLNESLILAFMRQESSFKPYAKSSVGARGLMQTMPATARFINAQAKLGVLSPYSRYLLNKPHISMTLGDAYLDYLLKLYDNNLVLAIAGYNAGPGNIKKWRKKTQYNKDPLLLIESIPSGENRNFLENVLANYWMYRFKHALPSPTLSTLSTNKWAMYAKDSQIPPQKNIQNTVQDTQPDKPSAAGKNTALSTVTKPPQDTPPPQQYITIKR